MRWPAKQRQEFIAKHLSEHGKINLSDIQVEFGIGRTQAQKDMKHYISQGGAAVYDAKAKCFRLGIVICGDIYSEGGAV